MERIAFCDFDGTLSSGYISMEFLDFLYEQNIYPKSSYEKQMQYFSAIKNGKMSYDEWCEMWGNEWANGLKDQKGDFIEQKANEFFQEFKRNIYPSSYQLMRHLKGEGYYITAVSVGAYEVISLAASELKMDGCFSTRAEIKEGVYTGNIRTNLHLPTGKVETLKKIADEKNVSLNDCLAMGDSASDTGMLEMVGLPIALNPSESLLKIAQEREWPVFNHKNIMNGIRRLLKSCF